MVVKINGKPLVVKEEEGKDFSWTYMIVTFIGYGLIFWIIRLAYMTFLGGY